jgi:hypothetical protein
LSRRVSRILEEYFFSINAWNGIWMAVQTPSMMWKNRRFSCRYFAGTQCLRSAVLISDIYPELEGISPSGGCCQANAEVESEGNDGRKQTTSLRLAFEHAQSIAMTLPRLLTQAIRAKTGQDNARYVFPLGEWILEGIEGDQSFILTLKTEDGFEVSFRIPLGASRSLGWRLQREAELSTRTSPPGEGPAGSGNPELH